MSKDSTKAALDRYFTKQQKKASTPPRKNQKPEFTLTVSPCLIWLREQDWSVDIVEAKATYNAQAGRYLEGQTEAGMSDIVGCTPQGFGAFIECKAPGKLSTVRFSQHQFLKDKIEHGAFAVVTDSVKRLENLYKTWYLSGRPKEYLLEELPDPPKLKNDIFNPELGF